MAGRMLRALLALLFLTLSQQASLGGELTRDKLAELFPAPMEVGERDAEFPVWPLFNGGAGEAKLAGWIFETTDLASIPGFSGTPPNLLVALAPDGTFLDVRVLSHHEPIFLDGLGEEPLFKFTEQYRGKALGRPIKIGSNINAAEKASSGAVYIDGILKATASVLVINQTVLASAIKVAKVNLGIAGSTASANPARPDIAKYEQMMWPQLLESRLVQRAVFRNSEIEEKFKGSIAEGLDPAVLARCCHGNTDICPVCWGVRVIGFPISG